MKFYDRVEAGRKLAAKLLKYKRRSIVYALPRGGVVLGAEVAKALDVPLDLLIPRKVGHPFNPEYAICAVTEYGEPVCNSREITQVDQHWLQDEINKERQEARRRRQVYLAGKARLNPKDKIAIIVDDGVATGLTMQAAVLELKARRPKKIVVAVPVIPADTKSDLMEQADEVVALSIPTHYLGAVGAYYENFAQIEDEEVIDLLVEIK